MGLGEKTASRTHTHTLLKRQRFPITDTRIPAHDVCCCQIVPWIASIASLPTIQFLLMLFCTLQRWKAREWRLYVHRLCFGYSNCHTTSLGHQQTSTNEHPSARGVHNCASPGQKSNFIPLYILIALLYMKCRNCLAKPGDHICSVQSTSVQHE